jgi:hypothetical protein
MGSNGVPPERRAASEGVAFRDLKKLGDLKKIELRPMAILGIDAVVLRTPS